MSDAGYTSSTEPGGRSVLTDDKVMPIAVHALYLLGFVTLVSPIVGLIIAHNSATEHSWRRSHYEFATRTFWLALAGFVVGGAAMLLGFLLTLTIIFALIGVPLMILAGAFLSVIGIWFGVRTGVALIYAAQGEEYPRPRTFLI